MITRLSGKNSPKKILNTQLTEFVKVERKHDVPLTPGEEFTLYITRLFFKHFSESQGACGDMMGVASSTFSEYANVLQNKGYVKLHTKNDGRSVWYEQLKEPRLDWSGIPKSFIRDPYIDWRDRLLNVKLYHLILDDVNEIHFTDKKIASVMGITMPTFRLHRDALLHHGIIAKLPKTDSNPAGGYRVDVYALLGLNVNVAPPQLKPIHQVSSYKRSIRKAKHYRIKPPALP
ncbi:hypothetical protein D1614_19090 [Maribellus luteus]|uniref:Uncharacterized protein n=1 Tax=Maribellus luteus TaxID=2305463 RepID=A0A399SUQ1_9BACT|nr:hypothetical protein [Maribellus luteus]RIJ46312.1 hypothetical protein D1614_19090 [Maribellus luteus]